MDLVVGGSILVSLLILISGVMWLKEISVTRKLVQYTVLFPNIGSLQIGDAVMVNGVKMGSVAKAAIRADKVAVAIDLDRGIVLTDSCRITVQNIGLMGERMVGIQLSDKGAKCVPDNVKKNRITYLTGYFDSGIAEAVGMLGTVLGEVEVLVKNVEGIIDRTVGDTAFIDFFQRVVARLDTISLVVNSLISQNKDEVQRVLGNLDRVSGDIRDLVAGNKDNINAMVANGTELTQRAVRISAELETLSVSLKNMATSIEKGEGAVGMIMEDEQFYKDLKLTIGRLDTLVTDVNDKGLKLRIKLGFRDDRKR